MKVSVFRYEIRDDRKKDSVKFENLIETLKNDILGAIWEKNSHIAKPRQTYPSIFTSDKAKVPQVQHDPPGYTSFHSVNRGKLKPSEEEAPVDGATNLKTEFLSQPGNNFFTFGQKAKTFTTTKVESYLSHLGDSFSSQNTDTFPAHNVCDSTQSRDYFPQSHTSYGYNLYSRGVSDSNSKSKYLAPSDIEHIKLEIMSSLKSEIQDTAREMTSEMLSYSNNAAMLPAINSELYQTHLYTQL